MFRTRHAPKTNARRGIILLVVLALLTLFAIVGISFVLYANSEADNSRVYLEAQGVLPNNGIDMDASTLLNYALGQCLFDVDDRPTSSNADLYSAMRGHSLARDMYGWDSDNTASNIFPFNGTGRFHTGTGTYNNPYNVDDFNLINYTYFNGDPFIRDPERYGSRNSSSAAQPPYTGGWNSPYTFPDLNHCYLAAVDSNGNVLMPSFARPWNGFCPAYGSPPGTPGADLGPTNPNWTNTTNGALKYMVLRPRPADMAPNFPKPASANGDVQNAVGITNGPDSFWMDLDYPVQTATDGTKYKPLFAFLIMDLDNRINLNLAGNIRASGNGHLSNRGYGPWEINPRLLSQPGSGDWPQLYTGNPSATPPATGRYGADGQPGVSSSSAPAGLLPHVYAQTDFDASNEGSGGVAPQPYTLPGSPAGNNNPCFPTFPPGYGNGSAPELLNHPLLYNFFSPNGGDRRFPISDMELLLNNGASGSLWRSSSFGQLCPNLFGSAKLRNLVTTHSYDVNRPGLMPWLFDRQATFTSTPYAIGTDPYGPPSGGGVALPPLTSRSGAVPQSSDFRLPGQSGNTGANAVDWRWNAVDTLGNALNKIDLNRFLSPYPHMGQGTSPSTYSSTPLITEDPATSTQAWSLASPAVQAQYAQAQQDRQNLAGDIYRVFLAVTGLPPVANPAAPTAAEMAPRRWLAQLAVNIVDYIDEDDISTPFNFGAQENPPIPEPTTATTVNTDRIPLTWVFGTELPRVVLNEVYAEFQQPTMPGTYMPMSGTFNVRVWAELYNPLPKLASLPAGAQPQDAQAVPLYIGPPGGPTSYQPYQVVIANTNPSASPNARGLWLPAAGSNQQNVLGTPGVSGTGEVRTQTSPPLTGGATTDFTQTRTLAAATPTISTVPTPTPPSLKPQDVLLLGPSTPPDQHDPTLDVANVGPDVEGTINVFNAVTTPRGQLPAGTNAVLTGNMQYSVTATYTTSYAWAPDDRPNGITVLLRRLANPYMPAQADPTMANYNPYITVDYMNNVSLRNDYTPRSTAPNFPTAAMTTWPPATMNTPPNYPSRGKLQPYAADPSQITYESYPPSVTTPPAQTTPTVHSLGIVPNAPAPNGGNYDWLVHLDRQLISPGELLQVSAYAPFLLTQQFITAPGGTTTKFTHRAPWFDEASLGVSTAGNSTRLYRALEFLDVHPRGAGVGFTGRVPGRVNINTIWDPETFQALCDAQAGNYFTSPDVSAIWGNLQASRGNPGPSANPFLGMAVPNSPGSASGDPWFTGSSGIGNTLVRPAGSGGQLLQITDAVRNANGEPTLPHPYQQNELLTKILNNVTTRSNVFAVWITVGFFRVVQDTDANGNPIRPIKLGDEIGASTGTNVRHRMFAIVDRSSFAIDQQVTTLTAAVPQPTTNPPGPVTVTIQGTPSPPNAITGTTPNTQISWSITPGTVLLVDTGNNKEAVLVTAVNGNQITATFQQGHAAGATVTIPGNPGPSPPSSLNPMHFDVTNLNPMYQDVVPYFAIIQ